MPNAKQTSNLADNRAFRLDAANLPAYLYLLQEKHPVQFRYIEEHIRLVAPFFRKVDWHLSWQRCLAALILNRAEMALLQVKTAKLCANRLSDRIRKSEP